MAERLDKFLANAGMGTRSEVKKMLKQGRVQVNELFPRGGETKVDPQTDQILVDGKLVSSEKHEYILLHKPAGYLTATRDGSEKTVMDLIDSPRKERIFPVGRLDKDTEGLLLITDDGELAHQLLSPKKHVPKTYFAKVSGIMEPECIPLFEKGLDIGDEKQTLPAGLRILSTNEAENYSEVEITVREGRYHQIKRMCHVTGHEVLYLKRISMGSLKLDDSLAKGTFRKLRKEETENLKKVRGKE